MTLIHIVASNKTSKYAIPLLTSSRYSSSLRTWSIELMSVSIFILITFGLSAQHEALRKEIDKIIRFDTELSYDEHPGYVVGIIDNDSTYILNFGLQEIDTFDMFEIGGLTKVFTADLVLSLEESGMLNLNDKINSFFPMEFRNENLDNYDISDLLMHQIAFPKRPSDLSKKEFDLSNPYAYYTKMDLLNYYQSFLPPKRKKWSREVLHYSHINYALLELIIETTTKMPYEKALQDFLLKALKLQSTTATLDKNNVTAGFDMMNETPSPWTYASFKASEGMYSNLNDLLSFMRSNLGIAEHESNSVITKSLIKQKDSKVSDKLGHSYAWYILSSRKTGDIFTHSGSTERHKVYMHFVPRTSTGVIILSRSVEGTGELGMLILRLINYNWKRN